MTMPDVSKLKVICMDDSPIVLSGMAYMLKKSGFTQGNITAVKTAREVLTKAPIQKYDIFICDYYMGEGLNGKQLFEELKNKELIKASTVFFIVSGESDSPTVKSILELNPDDFLLKPFNFVELKTRLLATIKRKYTLQPIFEVEFTHDYEAGIRRCEELEKFFPQYFFTIQRHKAKYLSLLKQYTKAESVYKSTLKQKSVDWAKLGLANTFVNTNRQREAFNIVNEMLQKSPSNANAHIEMSDIHLKINQLPKAITHLQKANKLVPGNSERELVIANLCNAVGDHNRALEHYRVYVRINEHTFRNNVYTQFNFLRQLLYAASVSQSKEKSSLLTEAQRVVARIVKEYDVEKAYKEQMQVALAHLALMQNKLKDASILLQQVMSHNALQHYYDCYHFAWLLNEMSFYTEFDSVIEVCTSSLVGTIDTQGIHNIVESQVQMASRLKERKIESTQDLVQKYKDASNLKQEGEMQQLLLTYIEIQKEHPYLSNVAHQILQLLSQIWPSGMNTDEVAKLVAKNNFIVEQLLSMNKDEKQKYQKLIHGIHKQINSRDATE